MPRKTGKFGLEVQNEAGQRLTEFCQKNALVMQTPFSNNIRDNSTHEHNQRVNINIRLIIYSLQLKMENSIQSAKTRPGADYGSDHELRIAKFRLKLKKEGKTTRPFRYGLNQIINDYTVEVRNRFRGLDLKDRVPEELWTVVHNIVQEAVIKTIAKKKKCKKAKWLSEEALQIATKRREAKGKGEKKRYIHLMQSSKEQ